MMDIVIAFLLALTATLEKGLHASRKGRCMLNKRALTIFISKRGPLKLDKRERRGHC